MRLECIKYKWDTGTEDIDINFFSDVEPTTLGSYDLYEYYVDETMSEIEYSIEDIDIDNTLYLKTSNLQLNVYDDNVLIDFFECYNANKYFKWKLNYYEEDTLIYSGIIYKDGINIDSVEDKILSLIVIGYEKEFKDYFQNKQLESSASFPTSTGVATNHLPNLTGLRFYGARTFFKHLFANISFYGETSSSHWLNNYYISEMAYTYSPNTNFYDYGNVIHIKTGYDCFYNDGISKMTFYNSMLLGYGWIWFFYLNQLVISERAAMDYSILEIDCEEVEVSQSLKHNYNQFQVDNVVIDNGEYFDKDNNFTNTYSCFGFFDANRPETQRSHSLIGHSSMIYSSSVNYSNRVRPFRSMVYGGTSNNTYLMDFRSHRLTRNVSSDEFNFTVEKIYLPQQSSGYLAFESSKVNYSTQKTLRIIPYINSRANSAGFDSHNPRANSGAYYGNGNFYSAANQPITDSHGLYNGSPSNAVIYYDADLDKYVNYEMYAQTDKFKRNFKKFLKTNDEVIIQIEVKQLITNPLQTIKLVNYQDADFTDKTFSIINLSFHPIDKISTLTLQMIN